MVMINPVTGEVCELDNIDDLLGAMKDVEYNITVMRHHLAQIKEAIYKKVEFKDTKTARIQGDKYKCKIEMPSKINWDQKKLSHMYSIYPHGTVVDAVIKIQSYKIDMREYKKLINTVGGDEFNKFKEELMSANLGIIGSPRFTIE